MEEYLRKLRKLQQSECVNFDGDIRKHISTKGGVYRIFRKRDRKKSLYVGMTTSNKKASKKLKQRIGSCWSGHHILRSKLLKKI